jgi:LacI family transcriptional regulator
MKKVMLMVDTSRASSRQFLQGIARYMHMHESWEVYIQPPSYITSNKMNFHNWIKQNNFDGIMFRDSPNPKNILNLNISKTVFLTTGESFPGMITICTDSNGISQMAAEYFIGLGFKNFAFCGFNKLSWSNRRLDVYRKILSENNDFNFFHYSCPHGIHDMVTEKQNISNWLRSLPIPLCVFACNDDRGIYILDVCKAIGLRVPEEIAVLGVDNDELVCDLSSPALSSIQVGFEKAGFEAAVALNRLMSGEKEAAKIIITAKPLYIVTRRSSELFAIEDQEVRKALIFIREHYKEPIQVGDVVEAACLSRRSLQLRFKKLLNRSIYEELNSLRINDIKTRLLNTTDPINMIATSLKYVDIANFTRFFKQYTSMSPKEYRLKYGNVSK